MRCISILLIFLTTYLQFFAQSVTSEEASQVADIFFYQSRKDLKSHPAHAGLKLIHTDMYSDQPIFYVFNSTDDEGFILVSAIKGCYPILGFSREGSYDPDHVPPALSELLEDYKEQVVESIRSDAMPEKEYQSTWDHYTGSSPEKSGKADTVIMEVKPLLNTRWNSGCLYNTQCPVDAAGPCGHVKVGCVAVAMAQILKYYSCPEQPRYTASYTHEDYGILSVDFDTVTYHWDRMPDHLDCENDDVARLMFHCGVSIHMDYGPTLSWANMNMAGNALIYHFNYSGKIEVISNYNDRYSSERWGKVLRKELDNFRPVYCVGDPPTHGKDHSYVIDGYFGDELLHYNWGWGGQNDGYYAVGAPFALIGVQPDICENDTLGPNPVKDPSYLIDEDSIFVSWEIPAAAEDGDSGTQFSLTRDGDQDLILYEPAFHFKWDSIGAYNLYIQTFDHCRIPSDSVTPLTVIVPDAVNYRPRINGFFPAYADTILVYSGVKKIFYIDHSDPNKDKLTFEWSMDNDPIPDVDSSRLVYDFRGIEPGLHSLNVEVSDHRLTRHKTWMLMKAGNDISIIDDKDSLILEGIWSDQVETNAHNGSFQWARGTRTSNPSAVYHFLPEKTGTCKLLVYIPDMSFSNYMVDSAIYEISINHVVVDSILVNQVNNTGKWVYLDSIDLMSDIQVSVRVLNCTVTDYWKQLVIDAIKFEYIDILDTEAPDLKVIDTICQGVSVEATSSETGWIYLVPEGTEKDLTVIEHVCMDSVISVSKAAVNIPISSDMEGTFWLYARDIHGNLSDPVAFTVVGMDKEVFERVYIFPNPVIDVLTIHTRISGDYILNITSLNGRVIHTEHITVQTYWLDISGFQNGVYFISIRSKDFITTKKIIKLK